MGHETAVDVLQDTFRFVVPSILSKFLHQEVHEERSKQMFDLTMEIMLSGRFNEFPAAMETLVSSAIAFAPNKELHLLVYMWFVTGKVTSISGQKIQGTNINVKVRHTMVRKLFSSVHIPRDEKKKCYATLSGLDKSDMLGRT